MRPATKMSDEDCIFCKIVRGEIPCVRVYEDDDVLGFLDINPLSHGHTLVIPKEHFGSLDQCPENVVAALAGKLPVIAKALISVVGGSAYNVLNNNGREAGQLVEHVHFHIIPRRAGDGLLNHGPQGRYSDGQGEELARQIRQSF